MDKKIVFTANAPAPIGPYSQAVKCGNMLFISGQLGTDPATNQLAPFAEEQTEQALRNMQAILASEGLTMDNVVKTTVFLDNFGDFDTMNTVYANFFTSGSAPARSCVEVEELPKGALVEIEAIACF